MNKTIVVSEDGMFANTPIQIPYMTDMFCSAITGAVQQCLESPQVKNLPALENQKLTKDLFDSLNLSFSKCLENAFPEIALRPDITEEAIMKAENEIIENKVVAFNKPKTASKKGE